MAHEFKEVVLAEDYQAVEEYLTLQHLHYVISTNDNNQSLLQFISSDPFYKKHLFKSLNGAALESIAAQETITENLSNILKLAKRMLSKVGLVSQGEAASLRKEAKNVDADINKKTNSLLKEIQDIKFVSIDHYPAETPYRHTYKTMIETTAFIVMLGNTINKLIRNSSPSDPQSEFFEESKEVLDNLLDKYDVTLHPNGSFNLSMSYIEGREGGDEHDKPWGDVNQVTLRNTLHGIAGMAHCEIVCYPIAEIIKNREQPEDVDPIKKKYQLFCLNLMISYVKTVRSISVAYLKDISSMVVLHNANYELNN